MDSTRPLNQSQPTTPLKRRPSRGSLSAFSASRSRSGDVTDSPLVHLSPLFTEIADDIEDLTANFAHLDALNDSLDTFNEAFASMLYGLKMNAFCEEFVEAPNKVNFEYAAKRAAAAAAARVPSPPPSPTPSSPASPSEAGPGDSTFQSGMGDRAPSTRTTGRGRGRGTTTAARGRAVAARKKERQLAFAGEIIKTLPIKYREEQPHRSEMEAVIMALRDKPDGLYVPDIVKLTDVPTHRVNEAALTLLRAKHAIKVASKGLLYRLDPERHPPEA